MLEVADIFRLHSAAYRARFGDLLFPSQTRAMRDIEACRTAYFGGHVDQCDYCQRKVYVYHSCGNRHCPKCHREQTQRWIEKQHAHLLPCAYYLLTFTLPAELRPLALAHQRKVYGLLMRCAAAALQKLARDPRFLGARFGCLAVLHTWTRAMLYHPHAHLLVTAGGISTDGTQWLEPKNPAFLVPVEAPSQEGSAAEVPSLRAILAGGQARSDGFESASGSPGVFGIAVTLLVGDPGDRV